MKIELDLDQIRVVHTTNYKGNDRVYLEIMDERILYANPWEMYRDPNWKHYITIEDKGGYHDITVDTEGLADGFRARIAHMMRDYILQDDDVSPVWTRDTDRGIDYTKPRLEVMDDV